MKLIFEISKEGRAGYRFPECRVPEMKIEQLIPETLFRKDPADLPEVFEMDLIRHYTTLSINNYGVDRGFYPLGSCTMKYNPRINEDVAGLTGFSNIHPLQNNNTIQGFLNLLYNTTRILCEISGMDWGTLQPFAGAHGEYTGMKLFKAYFKDRGEIGRLKILVPDSAHGTNPASAAIAGFDVVEIKSSAEGIVSVDSIKEHLDENLAGIMLTNPNTLGLFEKEVKEIADLIHKAGGLLYYDGANFNAIMGKVKPGEMGFDVVHLNLHKTFSTPHGGGGPGSGPVLVNSKLMQYLPTPDIVKKEEDYSFNYEIPKSIGRISGFYGNIAVIVKAYTYLLTMGSDGLKKVSELAVLNANYLKEKLKNNYFLPYKGICKHEFVISAKKIKEQFGVTAFDIAKGLLDRKIHPPTVYFPLIVPEALMIEPTETESIETLDNFVKIMNEIFMCAEKTPELLKDAPFNAAVKRVDEVLAAKKPIVRWQKPD